MAFWWLGDFSSPLNCTNNMYYLYFLYSPLVWITASVNRTPQLNFNLHARFFIVETELLILRPQQVGRLLSKIPCFCWAVVSLESNIFPHGWLFLFFFSPKKRVNIFFFFFLAQCHYLLLSTVWMSGKRYAWTKKVTAMGISTLKPNFNYGINYFHFASVL